MGLQQSPADFSWDQVISFPFYDGEVLKNLEKLVTIQNLDKVAVSSLSNRFIYYIIILLLHVY